MRKHRSWSQLRKHPESWRIYKRLQRQQRKKQGHGEWRAVRQNIEKTWLSIDGEGWGEDEKGRQCYRFMVAATDDGFQDILHRRPNEDRLRTADILEWLCWLPYRYVNQGDHRKRARPRVCGFGLGYDYAHIVLDFSLEQLQDLFHNQDRDTPWIAFENFLVKLTAGRLQVKRMRKGQQTGYVDVWDTFKYFQSAFAKASSKISTEQEKQIIAEGKKRRGDTEHDEKQEIQYALTECRVHSRLMKTVEDGFVKLELFPRSWYGPGSAAHMALRRFEIQKHHLADDQLPDALISAARSAFIGGRFETTGHGRLPFLEAYDINSAYPFAITRLPCLAHTKWRQIERGFLLHEIARKGWKNAVPFWSLLRVQWNNNGAPLSGGWGPWPTRIQPVVTENVLTGQSSDSKMLPVWPWKGEAWIWGPEFRAGVKLLDRSPKASWDIVEAWIPETSCDCRPFNWVEDWYYWRQQLQRENNPMEQWVKLVLNSLYGKMAQQIGRAIWHSWLWSGMITAHARAQLLHAIAQDPEHVVMTATDAVYSTHGLALDCGTELGAWKPQALGNALIVQSGFFDSEAVYGEDKPRTRGIPARYVDWDVFHKAWDEVVNGEKQWNSFKITLAKDIETNEPLKIHVGIGLAQLWGKPEMLGMWLDYPQEVGFVTDKRPFLWKQPPRTMRSRDWICTQPWYPMPSEKGAEYRAGTGIGEDKFLVLDQPYADEWGMFA